VPRPDANDQHCNRKAKNHTKSPSDPTAQIKPVHWSAEFPPAIAKTTNPIARPTDHFSKADHLPNP
jgi:hypothetical protein